MIQLSNGKMWDYENPDPSVLSIEVIAASLSKQARWSGHTCRFYSVAEHCVRGSYLCRNPLGFLLHDAAEALVIDVPRPLKKYLSGYVELENQHHEIIADKFNVVFDDEVRRVDDVMLVTEAWHLLPKPIDLPGVKPLTGLWLAAESGRSETWEKKYINRFKELTE